MENYRRDGLVVGSFCVLISCEFEVVGLSSDKSSFTIFRVILHHVKFRFKNYLVIYCLLSLSYQNSHFNK